MKAIKTFSASTFIVAALSVAPPSQASLMQGNSYELTMLGNEILFGGDTELTLPFYCDTTCATTDYVDLTGLTYTYEVKGGSTNAHVYSDIITTGALTIDAGTEPNLTHALYFVVTPGTENNGPIYSGYSGPFEATNSGWYADSITVTNTVPVPAAAWLFGSGLLGLVGIARRKKS